MVRRHGWQLPAHAFQVIAITVFFLLAIAFYVFVAPFLGTVALQYASIAIYTPVAFAVFVLYVRCSAIDPSDPGIFLGLKGAPATLPAVVHNNKLSHAEAGLSTPERAPTTSAPTLACLLCGWLSEDDDCGSKMSAAGPRREDDVLFCTLCNAEVRKFSKHCRSCDKCVDGFDHHCRWLNNCVGKKNYITFMSLMATSLTLLVLQWVLGTAALVHCFVDKKGTENQIINKLGASFSKAPFVAVVTSCTLVSLLASLPLGELLFFHIILIKKGITTYEYVVAMRAQSEAPAAPSVEGGDSLSVPTSPTSSTATGLSVSSSLGIQYRGAWCTPPRIFVDQEEIVPQLGPGRVPSTVDPDTSLASRREFRSQKRTVKISAWKLARLNADEAARAVSRARASSSILRPVHAAGGESDYVTSSNVSSRSSLSDAGLGRHRLAPGIPSSKFSGLRGAAAEDLSGCSSPSYSIAGSGMPSPGPRVMDGGRTRAAPLSSEQQMVRQREQLIMYGGNSIFYNGPMKPKPRSRDVTPGSTGGLETSTPSSTSTVAPRNRPLNRSQSPVFVPRQQLY